MSKLTIKHVPDEGCETIIQATQVSFYPAGQEGDESCNGPLLQAFGTGGDLPLGGLMQFRDGTVYVMNDAGRTVAKYKLN